jgi:hypothetical protein
MHAYSHCLNRVLTHFALQAIFTEGCVEVGGGSHCGAGAAAALVHSARRMVAHAPV